MRNLNTISTAIPLVRFHSTAIKVAFSRGSPTIPSSSWTREWQVARTCILSDGMSFNAEISLFSLKMKMDIIKIKTDV